MKNQIVRKFGELLEGREREEENNSSSARASGALGWLLLVRLENWMHYLLAKSKDGSFAPFLLVSRLFISNRK